MKHAGAVDYMIIKYKRGKSRNPDQSHGGHQIIKRINLHTLFVSYGISLTSIKMKAILSP